MRLTALALMLLPMPALAAEPMSAAEFEAYSTGKTLYYGNGDMPYGVEQYLPGRKVVWAFVGQECRHGAWYERDGLICFVYEHEPGEQCWSFYALPGGLMAQFAGDEDSEPLVEVNQTPDPMHCPGPDVGA